jgi:hypothetical protein
MGTGCRPIGDLQADYREGARYGRKKRSPFQGSPEGRRVLVRGRFMFP